MSTYVEIKDLTKSFGDMKALEYLYGLNHKKDPDKLKEVLQTVGLDPAEKKSVSKYSLGMRQRLAIAQAIIEYPPLLILDEPMIGLDNEVVS